MALNPAQTFALATLVGCLTTPQRSGAEERLNLPALLSTGAASVTHSPLDLGVIGNAFDGDAATLARSASINPLVITLHFTEPQVISAVRTRFLAGQNRWRTEAADSLVDLDNTSGSYQLLTDWKTAPEQLWSSNAPPHPHTLTFARFSLERLTGDNYVHLTDLEFFQPDHQIVLSADHDPFGLRWASQASQWYAIEESAHLEGWTSVDLVKAKGPESNWHPTNTAGSSRFFRLREAAAEEQTSVVKRVLVLNFDPILESEGGVRVHEHFGWNDPRLLTTEYLSDLNQSSGAYIRWEITAFEDLDEWPLKTDGFRYTDHTYLEAWRTNGFHQPDSLDYTRVVEDHDLDRRVREDEINEVILWGFPYAGFYESRMAGPTAYWCNSPGLIRPNTPLYILMGLNYERGVAEALHSFGHRAESILRHVYGSWSGDAQVNHLWDRFSRYDRIAPGQAACGNVHYPPNASADYDYSSLASVWSEANDWLNYPNLTGTVQLLNATAWGRSHRGFMNWWFTRMPKSQGRANDGLLHNWWAYLVDLNEYPESR